MMKIREANSGDAEALAHLSAQLGYPAEAATIARWLDGIVLHNAGVVFVAETEDGRVVGSAHVLVECSIVDEPKAHLADLVVDESCRSQGIGSALLRTCEAWACDKGLARMRVNSNVVRERAHRFYLREGYAEAKRQAVFIKPLI